LLRLRPDADAGRPLAILCLGAHSDDIEIGCGGTLLSLLKRHPGSQVAWMVLGAAGTRADEARASAAAFLAQAGARSVSVHAFRDGFFPSHFVEIKEAFERLKSEVDPDLILTHARTDRHQDHRTVSDLTWNTFRRHLILEYEIPKYDGDLGQPNCYVPLSRDEAEAKVDLLMAHFGTQRQRSWFTPDTFWALLRLRGIEAASPSGFAEGHYAHKLVL
jgi:LmbE family N-acetylglucosaminyl deacetylase